MKLDLVKMIIIIILSTFIASLLGSQPNLGGRIVGGVETTIEDIPYQASVRYNGVHACGGVILNENTVITTCNCVYRLDRQAFTVIVGSAVHYEGDEYIVSKIVEHPYYNKESIYDNDIAIIKLNSSLTFSSKVQPIELQPQGKEVPENTKAIVSGWGITREGNENITDVLRKVDVNIITEAKCKQSYEYEITIHMICALSPDRDSCQGDSGGPLVAGGKLVGLVSWGIGCARPQYPGVYTKISSLHNWIVDHI